MINSSKNSYQYWNLRSSEESVLSMQFKQIESPSLWDNYTFLKIYDKTLDSRSEDLNMSAWANLIDVDGQFKSVYSSFTSRSPSVMIVYSSLMSHFTISISGKEVNETGIIDMIYIRLNFNCDELCPNGTDGYNIGSLNQCV